MGQQLTATGEAGAPGVPVAMHEMESRPARKSKVATAMNQHRQTVEKLVRGRRKRKRTALHPTWQTRRKTLDA